MRNCFSTQRLILRAPEIRDIDFIYKWENDVTEWDSTINYMPMSRELLYNYIRNYTADPMRVNQLMLIIESKEEHRIIGMLELFDINILAGRASVGIYIEKPFRRNGYASESLEAVSHYCIDHLDLRLLSALISKDNIGSLSLFEKCGYARSGVLKEWFKRGPYISDAVISIKKL